MREVLGSIPRTALLPVWFHGAARLNHPAPDLQCIRLPHKATLHTHDTCGIRAHTGRPHRLSRPTPWLSRPTPWPLGQSVFCQGWQLLGQSVLLRRTSSGAMSPPPMQTVLRSCFRPAGVFVRAALPAGAQGVFTQQSHEVDSRGCSSWMFHWIHGHHWLFGLVA